MMYVKSTLTGQIYEMDFIPTFGGYEVVSKEEYEEWKKEAGL